MSWKYFVTQLFSSLLLFGLNHSAEAVRTAQCNGKVGYSYYGPYMTHRCYM